MRLPWSLNILRADQKLSPGSKYSNAIQIFLLAKTTAILSVKKLFKRKTSSPPSKLNFSVIKLIILSSYYVYARYKNFTHI